MPRAVLDDRFLLELSGKDAETLLQNVVTCAVSAVQAGRLAYGGLLSPQGKILADFLIHPTDGGFLLDMHDSLGADVARRLTMYRLRSRVEIRSRGDLRPIVIWGESPPGDAAADPRHGELGWRLVDRAAGGGDASAWHALRIDTTVPECGIDYAPGSLFPHEAGMASLGGVDFKKGCYVGQEVVSRMAHRGSVRRRVLSATGDGPWPPPGAELQAGERVVGQLGSSSGRRAIVFARLDRVRRALAEGLPLRAGAVEVDLALPAWADYGWASETSADG